MNIEQIMQDLVHHNVLHSVAIPAKRLSGGTVSKLYLIERTDGNSYVVKMNEPRVVKSESIYLNYYQSSHLLPKLIFLEPSNTYLVYSFITGSTDYPEGNKREILQTLIHGLVNDYKEVSTQQGWGWADQPSKSWRDFLEEERSEKSKMIGVHLADEDHELVCNLVQNMEEEREAFLLHGDCGVHNFIFDGGRLQGVIDPTPVIGNPLYDVIYAFCSSPDELTIETFHSILDQIRFEREASLTRIYEKVLIGLYLRIGIAIKHHPSDLDSYLVSWQYWRNIVLQCRNEGGLDL
ncbi:phosphotransferase family protein [Paenibacillus xylanexedens]|uniref:phosphotransferase family protein n=1 Tax=Paenibacillus xylanexedens TaxID=528191 RepID=UPI0011A80ECA|nr:aminoglycoside phosphotransferase family protein [Paenibacillus xylanexedens]